MEIGDEFGLDADRCDALVNGQCKRRLYVSYLAMTHCSKRELVARAATQATYQKTSQTAMQSVLGEWVLRKRNDINLSSNSPSNIQAQHAYPPTPNLSGRRRPGHLARVSPPRQSRPISIDFVRGSVRVSQPARLIRMSSVNSEAEEESQEGKPQRGAAPGRAVGDDGKRKKDEKSVILRSRDKFSAV